MKLHHSLRNFLLLNFILVAASPLIIVGYLFITITGRNMERVISERNSILASSVGEGVDFFLKHSLQELEHLRGMIEEESFISEDQISRFLHLFLKDYDLYHKVEIMDSSGTVQYIAPFSKDDHLLDNSRQPYFQIPWKEGQTYWSSVFIDPKEEVPSLILAIPFSEGVIATHMSLLALEIQLGHLGMEPSGYVVLTDQEGTIIAYQNKDMMMQRENMRSHTAIRMGLERKAGTVQYSYNEEAYIGSIYLVPGFDWVVAVVQPEDIAFRSISHMQSLIFSGAFIAIVLAVVVAILSLNWALAPLAVLTECAQSIAGGQYDIAFGGRSYLELQELLKAFYVMSSAVRNREQDLIGSEKRQKTLLDNLPQTIFFKDSNSVYISCNNKLSQELHLPIEEIIGKNDFDLYSEDIAEKNRTEDLIVLETGTPLELDDRRHVNGEERIIHINKIDVRDYQGRIIGVLGIVVDITEKYRVDEKIRNMQKIEAVGQLAGGIAHDFNNILTGLFGNIALAKLHLTPDHPAYPMLVSAESSMSRATGLTGKLLTFAKGGAPILGHVSLPNLLKEVVEFDLTGSNVKLDMGPTESLMDAKVDKGQIQQLFSNLTINAKQAMPRGGHLHIKLDNFDNSSGTVPELYLGNFIRIMIQDEGVGVPPEDLERIFEPYFTTKTAGNGLGLATVYSIVKRHNGHIQVHSEEGKGTTFILYLPATEVHSSEVKAEASPQEQEWKVSGRIMIVDDEKNILKLTSRILEKYGYKVDAVQSAGEALEKYKKSMEENPYDAVILDLTIPGGMGGKDLIQELKKIDPQVRGIVSSGYADDPVMANFRDYGFMGIAVKPYSMNELVSVVASVLTM